MKLGEINDSKEIVVREDHWVSRDVIEKLKWDRRYQGKWKYKRIIKYEINREWVKPKRKIFYKKSEKSKWENRLHRICKGMEI